ncbi:MAG: hypothetical protein DMD54_16660 [Gemmatimonadetes bacterium]|nr:MAG: hypothetical protein DMD54_16660 [Gemmatimonadota bacterium]
MGSISINDDSGGWPPNGRVKLAARPLANHASEARRRSAAPQLTRVSLGGSYRSTSFTEYLMNSNSAELADRLEKLERTVRRLRLVSGGLGIALISSFLMAAQSRTEGSDVLKTQLLIVQDGQGRDRIRLGAPMPDGRQYVGMQILNSDGLEQFGLGLKPDGAVSMGFDTKPGVGDQRNRERLNMGVTATGQGWIRYLDNQTRARLRLALDSVDAPSIQFMDWPGNSRIVVRQVGFTGDTTLEWKH